MYCCRRIHEQIVCSERYAQPHAESSNRSCACMHRIQSDISSISLKENFPQTARLSLQRELRLTRYLKHRMPTHYISSCWLC